MQGQPPAMPMWGPFDAVVFFAMWATMMSVVFLPLVIGNAFLARRFGKSPALWAILSLIPFVNFVFFYYVLYKVVFRVLDRLNEFRGGGAARTD